jgi:NAD(P)-dependent dehydrogenase (short-subunit alcohol dehydrogenase family)
MEALHRRWLITGASSGFGRAIAEAVLAEGDAVVATARRPAALADLAERRGATVRALDVTDGGQVREVVAEAVATGGVDVLVNCAGHGLIGALEELTDAEFRGVMETNLFGALAVTKAVLPHMRERGSGHIVQMSSMGGVSANPGHAVYATSKFAIEGASEALAGEVAPFGIRVTIVEPGPFRTDFAGRSMLPSTPMAAYAGTPRGRPAIGSATRTACSRTTRPRARPRSSPRYAPQPGRSGCHWARRPSPASAGSSSASSPTWNRRWT